MLFDFQALPDNAEKGGCASNFPPQLRLFLAYIAVLALPRNQFNLKSQISNLKSIDCWRAGQKNENCANYLLASGFDFTPDFWSLDLISFLPDCRNWYDRWLSWFGAGLQLHYCFNVVSEVKIWGGGRMKKVIHFSFFLLLFVEFEFLESDRLICI